MENIEFISLEDFSPQKNADVILYLDKILGHTVNEQVWNWEFVTNKNTIFTLLKDGKKNIATQSMLPVKLNIGGKLFDTAKSETSYLDADYRGKKLFEKLYAFAIEKTVEKGSVCVWGFTPAVKAWRNNFLFNVHEGLTKYVEIQVKNYSFSQAQKNSTNFAKAFAKFVGKNLITLKTKQKIASNLSGAVKLTTRDTVLAKSDLEDFYTAMYNNNKNLIAIEVDDNYLDWRITKNPAINYTLKFFYIYKKLVGYTIYTVKDDRLMITDLAYENEAVLFGVIKYFSQLKDTFTRLYYWGNDTCEMNALIFSTFETLGGKRAEDKSRNFVYKTYGNEDLSILSDTKNWYINGLWTEGFYI